MSQDLVRCVLLADRHHGLAEGIRGLLATMFEAVVMVADETSLQTSALRLNPAVVVVDLALTQGDSLGLVRRLRALFPELKLVLLSMHDEAGPCLAVMEAGANAVVLKWTIATDLLAAIEAVQAGKTFVSPAIKLPFKRG